MKHSKDTSGFSSDSLPAFVAAHLLPTLSLPPSNFRILSPEPGPTRPGDAPVFLVDGARPRPESPRIAGDVDLLPEHSPLSLLLPYPDPVTVLARPGDGSDLRTGDLPTVFSLCISPENGRFLTLAGDLCRVSLNSSFLSPLRSRFSVTDVEALTLSLRVLQISDASEASSAANVGNCFLNATPFWWSLSRSRGADLMKGLAFLGWGLVFGDDKGLTRAEDSERISLTISSSGRGWLGGGDLLMPAFLVVVLRGGGGLSLVLTQQPIW